MPPVVRRNLKAIYISAALLLAGCIVTAAALATVKLHNQTKLIKQLYKYRFVSESQRQETGYDLHALPNPFHAQKDEIRNIKKASASIDAMWKQLTPVAQQYSYFGNSRDLPVGAMLVVAAFYDYGNKAPNDAKPGCVSINENTDFKSLEEPTFLDHSQSEIGCCTDFALMLASFLTHLGIDVEVLNNGNHQALMISTDGKNGFLDSNSLTFIPEYFAETPEHESRDIYYFTPYDGSRVDIFQQFLMRSVMFGEPQFQSVAWKHMKPAEHFAKMRANYLIRDGAPAYSQALR
ncbi:MULTISPECIES: hypothetical protein [Mesorhizobium]|nr:MULTISPECIES: hypothetical protein [Mesorhizobium]